MILNHYYRGKFSFGELVGPDAVCPPDQGDLTYKLVKARP